MNDRARLSGPAQEMLLELCTVFRVPPHLVLRVIVESFLDAASDDGALQGELVAAARDLRRTGDVPGCWLVEDDGEDEPPDPETDAWARLVAFERACRF